MTIQVKEFLTNMSARTVEPEISISLEEITPQAAKTMLLQNTNNRNMRKRQVEALARDMKNGNWKKNAETIKISPTGQVVDGQHRLAAVVLSGQTIPLFVARNVELDTQLTVDTGSKRSFADHLKLQGEVNTPVLASATRALYLHNTGRAASFRSAVVPTLAELEAVLRDNPNLRDSVAQARKKSVGLGFSKSVLAFTHYILSSIDAEDAEYFFEHLRSGANLPEDSPIYRLRAVSVDREKNNPSEDMWNFAIPIVFKAWNKFRDGSKCSQLGFRRGGANPEKFPIPR